MLSGFNTDVDRSGTVLHVQTEDKGESVAVIESLVYLGGQILERRKTSYREMVKEGQGPKEIHRLLDAQHRGLIEEIGDGAFDDHLPKVNDPATSGGGAGLGEETEPVPGVKAVVLEDRVTSEESEPEIRTTAGPESGPGRRPSSVDENDPPLDDLVLDYLSAEQEQDGLQLSIQSEEGLELGKDATVRLIASTRRSEAPLAGVSVTVKMISTVSQPLELGKATTDAEGRVVLEFRVPNLRRGSGALIISGFAEVGTTDIQRLL